MNVWGEIALRSTWVTRGRNNRGFRAGAVIALALSSLLIAGCGNEVEKPANDNLSNPAVRRLQSTPEKLNVVVILIDTLRPDHLGFNGHSRETAPYLASLAKKSVVFSEAVSTSTWTAPSTASLFTGLHPLRHGVQLGIVAHGKRLEMDHASGGVKLEVNRMPMSVATLPELFRESGYRTFGIAANPNIGSAIGFDRGFDRFQLLESRPLSTEEARAAGRPAKPFRWANGVELYEELSGWKDAIVSGPEPFFLYIHINDVHDPYEKHAGFYREPASPDFGRALYDSGIGYVDEILSRIHSDFAFDDNTIIAVVSDHGEAFGEHGYFAHRRGVYGETNRILWMLSAPGLGVEPARVDRRVSIMEVLPTLLELSGSEAPLDRDGLSLAPLLRRRDVMASPGLDELERQLNERTLVVNRVAQNPDEPESWAVMRGKWKWIQDGERSELYDLVSDPDERHNRILDQPIVSRDLMRSLAVFREQTRRIPSQKVDVLLDPETVEALRELGYGE